MHKWGQHVGRGCCILGGLGQTKSQRTVSCHDLTREQMTVLRHEQSVHRQFAKTCERLN